MSILYSPCLVDGDTQVVPIDLDACPAPPQYDPAVCAVRELDFRRYIELKKDYPNVDILKEGMI